jgi:hypothetical protein
MAANNPWFRKILSLNLRSGPFRGLRWRMFFQWKLWKVGRVRKILSVCLRLLLIISKVTLCRSVLQVRTHLYELGVLFKARCCYHLVVSRRRSY